MMPSLETQDLARSLLADEAVAGTTSAEPTMYAAVRVCEKLRRPLCALAGADSHRALLSRALALARTEAPGLGAVQVMADGSLLGLGELETQSENGPAAENVVILIAHLLGLCLSFIGTEVTLRLVQEESPQPETTKISGTPTPFETILQEVRRLNSVVERLESLADEHPIVQDALMRVSGNIHNSSTALEVLALIRNKANRLPKDAPPQPPARYKM